MIRRRTRLLAALSAVLLLAGCSSQPSALSEPSASAAGGLSGELSVFAAASLVGSFDELGAAFARENTGLTVREIVYDGSSTLVTQITEGASADVFASADAATMKRAVEAGLIAGQPAPFASNTLQIAVAPGNPKHITGLADLAAKDRLVVLCAPKVPCGSASHEILRLDGVRIAPVSEEQNVKAVLTKVSAGEADAGLVYRTDITASNGSVEGVDIAGADRVVNRYMIGVPKDARNPAAGAAFVTWVLSDAGQKILEGFGFGKP